MEKPVIYEYLDYRLFLKDMFQFRKAKDRFFSYRYFAKKSGFSSPNFLKLVIDGVRNLTNSSVAKVAKGFALRKQEHEFFENLVFMNQSEVHDEKNYYYKKMISAKGYAQAHKIDKANFKYFSKWYYPVIREMIVLHPSYQTPEGIAAKLSPKISIPEAKAALRLLEEMGLIRKNSKGEWEQCNQVISTGPEVRSIIIGNFHREMIKLGVESIDRYPPHIRDISALTLTLRKDRISEIKARIASFRQELLDLACNDDDPDQVTQINIQVFPLTNDN